MIQFTTQEFIFTIMLFRQKKCYDGICKVITKRMS